MYASLQKRWYAIKSFHATEKVMFWHNVFTIRRGAFCDNDGSFKNNITHAYYCYQRKKNGNILTALTEPLQRLKNLVRQTKQKYFATAQLCWDQTNESLKYSGPGFDLSIP